MWLNTAEVPGLGFVCTGVQPALADTSDQSLQGSREEVGFVVISLHCEPRPVSELRDRTEV